MAFLSLIIIPNTDSAPWVRHFYHSRGTRASSPLNPITSRINPEFPLSRIALASVPVCLVARLLREACQSNLGYRSLAEPEKTQLQVDKNLPSLPCSVTCTRLCVPCSRPTSKWTSAAAWPWLCGLQAGRWPLFWPCRGIVGHSPWLDSGKWAIGNPGVDVHQIKYYSFPGNSFPHSPTRTPLPLITMPLVTSLDFLIYSVYQMLISHPHSIFSESLQ